MRIKRFRGRTSDGRWHEGDYVSVMGGTPRIIGDYVLDKKGNMCFPEGQFSTFYVEYGTVSQFIGLRDKNGTMIYEGDIVKAQVGLDEYEGIVKYDDERAMFLVSAFPRNTSESNDKFCVGCEYITEVIGNKWDGFEIKRREI